MSHGFAGRGQTTMQLVVRSKGAGDLEQGQREVWRQVSADPRLEVRSAVGYAVSTSEQARGTYRSGDGRTAVTTVALGLADGDARRELPAIQRDLNADFEPQGLTVALVSQAALWGEVNQMSVEGLVRAELIALPLLVLIMLWLYRGVVPALLSLAVAFTAIVGALGVLRLIAEWVELSVFIQNAATMLGLGVAVDYSLFLISRFQEELYRGASTARALHRTMATAGHTVLASGVTVLVAMSSLFLIDLPVIRSLATGAVVVVAVGVLANLVLLPALLVVAGRRVRPMARRSTRGWDGWARRVMAAPWRFLVVGLGLMLALAIPAAGLSTFTPDARIVPKDAPVRAGIDAIRAGFGEGATSPMDVVLTTPSAKATEALLPRLSTLSTRWADDPRVAGVRSPESVVRDAGLAAGPLIDPSGRGLLPADLRTALEHYVSADGRRVVVEVTPGSAASSEDARALLQDVRASAAHLRAPGTTVAVGGETAEGVDANERIADAMPMLIGAMLAVIYVVLLLTFRSLLLPLKAILLNLASVGASYGVLVMVFQWGWGDHVLGFDTTGHLTNFVPVLLLALLFSLSTDYEVFLLGRVREEYDGGAGNTESVANGLTVTAPLISGAALLMIAVFASFTLAGVVPVQQLGLGMAVAIALDATIVRLVLVPASMRLLGEWNWWLPGRSPGRRPGRHQGRPAGRRRPTEG